MSSLLCEFWRETRGVVSSPVVLFLAGKFELHNVVFIAQVYGRHNNGAELARAAAGYGAQNSRSRGRGSGMQQSRYSTHENTRQGGYLHHLFIVLIVINDTDYTSLFLSSGIVYQLRGDHDSALKLHQVNTILKFCKLLPNKHIFDLR
jgi:hypothetical protein